MDSIQEQYERTVGDQFIHWYNKHFDKSFKFLSHRKERDAPDLIYSDGINKIGLEITGAYYDLSYAAFEWQNIRRKKNAPKSWSGVNPDDNLIYNINVRLKEKCEKSYGNNCILLIEVSRGGNTIKDIENRLSEIKIPDKNPFLKIYLTGDFYCYGGYHCWEISSMSS